MNRYAKVTAAALATLGISATFLASPAGAAPAKHAETSKAKTVQAATTKVKASKDKPATATPAAAYPVGTVSYPTFHTDGAVARSACGVSVASYVAALPAGSDDTTAFAAAMTAAVTQAPTCFPAGPSGAPQAVVYVPAGTYVLNNLKFPSNVRLEINAGATLQLPPTGGSVAAAMINWGDGGATGAPAVTNVSVIGVGHDMNSAKQTAITQGGQSISPFNLATDFTMNLDAAATGSTNYGMGMDIANVQYFLVQNLFSMQNATDQPYSTSFAWPTSGRPVLQIHARTDSPLTGPYLQPMHGLIQNQVDVNAPRGFGPNQINAATDLHLQDIYTQGGTAVRMETDGSMDANGVLERGATVDGLTADDIVANNCNRAVSFSPNAQHNGSAIVTDVWAYSCYESVVFRKDQSVPTALLGEFTNASATNVYVDGGTTAQNDSTVNLWDTGMSKMRVCISTDLGWPATVGVTSTSGTFSTTK